MHDLLTSLLQANLAVAAAVLAVLALRKGVRAAFGARVAYALWLLVPLAAAASLAPPRPAELLPVAPAPLAQAAEQTAAALWTWGAEAAAPTGLDPIRIGLGLWLAGLALMVGWLAWRQSQFMLLLRHGEAGPAVIGFLRPRIVTPSDFEDRFDSHEQAVVLAHEKIHIARHDARINAAVALARCICWFNPLVHIAAHMMRMDQELACDAAVVARHPKARGPYAQALLKAQLAARPLPLGCYWPARSEHPLTERIAMLKRSDPSTIRRRTGGVLITVLAAGASYAAWAAAPAAAPAASAPLAYIEAALAPDPQPAGPQAPAHEAVKPKAGVAKTPAAADICLTNACGDPVSPVARPALEKVTYVGAGPVRARQAFVKYFDASAPVSFRGRVSEVRMTDGMAAELIMQAEDGVLYRVLGGDPAALSPENRARVDSMLGRTLDVSGYLAHDRTCEGGCLVQGRVVFTDGRMILDPEVGTASQAE